MFGKRVTSQPREFRKRIIWVWKANLQESRWIKSLAGYTMSLWMMHDEESGDHVSEQTTKMRVSYHQLHSQCARHWDNWDQHSLALGALGLPLRTGYTKTRVRHSASLLKSGALSVYSIFNTVIKYLLYRNHSSLIDRGWWSLLSSLVSSLVRCNLSLTPALSWLLRAQLCSFNVAAFAIYLFFYSFLSFFIFFKFYFLILKDKSFGEEKR